MGGQEKTSNEKAEIAKIAPPEKRGRDLQRKKKGPPESEGVAEARRELKSTSEQESKGATGNLWYPGRAIQRKGRIEKKKKRQRTFHDRGQTFAMYRRRHSWALLHIQGSRRPGTDDPARHIDDRIGQLAKPSRKKGKKKETGEKGKQKKRPRTRR